MIKVDQETVFGQNLSSGEKLKEWRENSDGLFIYLIRTQII